MKRFLLANLLVLISLISQSQNVKADLGTNGKFIVLDENADSAIVSGANSFKVKLGDQNGRFIILNNGTPGVDEFVKLLIRESGEVNWYLDKQEFFIRDGFLEAFPIDSAGNFYRYNFIKIDGKQGRIGFNVLDGRASPSPSDFPKDRLTSSIHLFGSIAKRVRLMDGTKNYELKQDDHTLILDNSSNNPLTDIFLPLVDSAKGREYRFKRNIDRTGKIFIKPQSGEKLNGVVDEVVELNNENASLEIVCDGESWWVITSLSPNLATNLVTSSYTVLAKDHLVLANATSGSLFLDLPSAAGVGEGKAYTLKRTNTGANFVTIRTDGSETMDGLSELRLNQAFDYLTLVSDGANWLISSERISATFVSNPASPYTVSAYDETITANTSTTMNLPSVSNVLVGKKITFKNTGANNSVVLTIDPNGSETIEGGPAGDPITLNRDEAITLQSDGTGWFIINFFTLP